MAEKKTTATKATTEADVVSYPDDSIEHIDKGDHWEVHDRRLPDEVVTTVPKTQRDVPLDEETQKEVADRMKMEDEIEVQKAKEALQEQEPPPVAEADVTVGAKGKES